MQIMIYTSNIDQHQTHMTKKIHPKAKANILIIHGMAEHRFRYKNFIDILFQNQYSVFAIDLRGHGESLIENKKGFFAKTDGYLKNIEDIKGIIDLIHEKYPNKLILLGHSMGSLFARAVLRNYPHACDALILSGSPYPPKGSFILRKFLYLPAKFFPKSESRIIYRFMNYGFNKHISDPQSNCDWLSFDQNNVQKYIQDPLCNFPFTLSAYYDLFSLMKLVYQDNWLKVDSLMPIHFIIGAFDPCADFKNDGFNQAITKLRETGYHNITSKIYPNSRHELLNDQEKAAVTSDLIAYIKSLEL